MTQPRRQPSRTRDKGRFRHAARWVRGVPGAVALLVALLTIGLFRLQMRNEAGRLRAERPHFTVDFLDAPPSVLQRREQPLSAPIVRNAVFRVYESKELDKMVQTNARAWFARPESRASTLPSARVASPSLVLFRVHHQSGRGARSVWLETASFRAPVGGLSVDPCILHEGLRKDGSLVVPGERTALQTVKDSIPLGTLPAGSEILLPIYVQGRVTADDGDQRIAMGEVSIPRRLHVKDEDTGKWQVVPIRAQYASERDLGGGLVLRGPGGACRAEME